MPLSISKQAYDPSDVLLLAHCSDAAYAGSAPADIAAYLQNNHINVPASAITIFNGIDDTQAFGLVTAQELIISFRGTEPTDWKNWEANFDADQIALPSGAGKVHQGFYDSMNSMLPAIEVWIAANPGLNLAVCGHSLGGAMAILYALVSNHYTSLLQVYTYGQPRVGNSNTAQSINNAFGTKYFRFVDHHDLVPHVPPALMNYRHGGCEVYFDGTQWNTGTVQVESLLEALHDDQEIFGLDPAEAIEDHLMANYFLALAHL